ncbi:tumor necrosis factor-like [Chiloscyllium plagiosum]|uniref:tumor necrosis factor-like n=1 Tax=Chiloscyllium plagiosum TaxID=36176 RepID=UPI001CB88799|nr:tumor necrosis factor-like [Chiloscyllium plagiosum]
MGSERMLVELEHGREREAGSPQGSARCLTVLSTFTLLALVTGCGYLLFTQTHSPAPSQANWVRQAGSEFLSFPFPGLPRLMKQVGSDPRPRIAAHLTANPIPQVSDVLTWQEQAGIAFSYGVEFSNNSLLIKQAGFYFIYTQVVFHYSQCEDSTIFLSHDMHKLSLAYPEETILLRATKSVCHHGSHSDPWFKTSYQGAIFEFEEGDRIFSRVSENVVRYLDKTEGKTFFGIFAL